MFKILILSYFHYEFKFSLYCIINSEVQNHWYKSWIKSHGHLTVILSWGSYHLFALILLYLGCNLEGLYIFSVMLLTHFFLCRHCLRSMKLIPSRNLMEKNDHLPCEFLLISWDTKLWGLKLTVTGLTCKNYKRFSLDENIILFINFFGVLFVRVCFKFLED